MNNLSYWESNAYFIGIDYLVVGSGIVGLTCAYYLRQSAPHARILLMERGVFPEGASTKNAGFACFGTLSEILNYKQHHDEAELFDLVARRFKGINKLRKLVGDEQMEYRGYGGFEIFRPTEQALWEKCLESLEQVNSWLSPIFGAPPFHVTKANPYFAPHLGILEAPFEGQIHSGKLLRALVRLVQAQDIPILTGMELRHIEEEAERVQVLVNGTYEFCCRKVVLCTNAFIGQFFPLEVQPARAQVLVTNPLPTLAFRGSYHFDEGFYFFRNTEDGRVLFGGGRNLDLDGENTTDFGLSERIQKSLEEELRNFILPQVDPEQLHIE